MSALNDTATGTAASASATIADKTPSTATADATVTPPLFANSLVAAPPTTIVPGSLASLRNDLPPEVTSMIASYLSQVDIARCCRVSLRWHWLWFMDLWTRIQIITPLQCRHFDRSFSRTAFLSSLQRIVSFESIQGLLHGQLLLSGAGDALKKLKSVQLTFPDINTTQATELETVLDIIRRASSLQHISLSGIRRLSPVKKNDPRSACTMFWMASDILRSLFIEFETLGWVGNEQDWKFEANGVLPVLPALEHFSVSGLISEELIVAFMERCPRLLHLEVHRDRTWPLLPTLLASAVRNRSATLRALSYDVPAITDETVSLFLEGGRWQHLSFSPSGMIGNLSRAILLSGASTMESLVVEGVRGFGGEFLQDFFVAASNLQVFSGLTFSRPNIHEFDLSQLPVTAPVVPSLMSWSCLGLEHLALNFGGVPRSDLFGWNSSSSTPSAVVTSNNDHTTEEIQKIYRQLAQLTSLKEICLGHGVRSKASLVTRMPHRNRTIASGPLQAEQLLCISLSLASGLRQLAGLKRLYTLDISGMAHKIGVEELEWMRENWPVLHSIIGLEDRVGISVPDKWQGECLRCIREWMARHPHGIGSAYPSLP